MTNATIKINRPELNKRNANQVSEINYTLDSEYNSNAQYHKVHGVLGIVTFNDRSDRPCAHFYWRDRKNGERFYYKNDEQRAEGIARRIKTAEAYATRIEDRKATKKQLPTIEVGDVLNTSWGYEQTNVEFYQVIARKGKTGVTLRRIASQQVNETSWCSADVKPVKDAFIEDPIQKRISHYGVKIHRSATARKTNWEDTHHSSWGY